MRRALAAGLLALGLSACGGQLSAGYLPQAAEGQFWLLRSRRPVSEVVADQTTPEPTQRLLSEVPAIKQFGELYGLKPTSNYDSYVDVGSPAVTWVVSACDPVAFRSTIWKFPIIGAITYVGWFDRSEADAHAERLRGEGLDVDVRGAGAYSTLGWLPDPVLSSMLHPGEGVLGGLVDVVLHESVHATYYLNGQSYLNESLAMFVAHRLTRAYLSWTRGSGSAELLAYEHDQKNGDRRRRGLHQVYEELDQLYRGPLSRQEKLARKAAIMAEAQRRYGGRALNNAVLVQYKTYGADYSGFEDVFEACRDWPRFWGAIQGIKASHFSQPQQEDLGPALREAVRRCSP